MAHPSPVTRIGLLLQASAVLALLTACDTKEAQPSAEAPPAAQQAAPQEAQAPAPAKGGAKQAQAELKVAGPFVTAGSEGNLASVDPVPEGQYQWTILGGLITDGGDSPSATYKVDPAARFVNLFCHIKGAEGEESTGFAHQGVTPMPVIAALEARPAVTTLGTLAKLAWTASDFKTLTLDPGAKDVSAGVGISVQPSETTTYTLTAINEAGTKATKQVTLKVVPAPSIKSFGATGVISIGQPLTLRGEFQGGKAEIRQGDTVLASSEQSPISVVVTLGDQASYMLIVTNETGAAVTQTRNFQRYSK